MVSILLLSHTPSANDSISEHSILIGASELHLKVFGKESLELQLYHVV